MALKDDPSHGSPKTLIIKITVQRNGIDGVLIKEDRSLLYHYPIT